MSNDRPARGALLGNPPCTDHRIWSAQPGGRATPDRRYVCGSPRGVRCSVRLPAARSGAPGQVAPASWTPWRLATRPQIAGTVSPPCSAGTPRPPVAARPAVHGSVAVGDPPPAAEGLHLDDGRGRSGGRADVALRSDSRRSPLGDTEVRTASTPVVVARACRGHAFVRPSGPCRALHTVAEHVGEVWPSSAPPARPRRRLLNMPAYPTRTAAAMSARTSGVSAPG
jgi:hypothetical protein